jgi:hypothetical protein
MNCHGVCNPMIYAISKKSVHYHADAGLFSILPPNTKFCGMICPNRNLGCQSVTSAVLGLWSIRPVCVLEIS